jgi:hypothetical protein
MVGAMLTATLSSLGRATAAQVGRRGLAPCRLVRRIPARLRRRRRGRAFDGVDWFDDIGPDELAG